MTADSSMPAGRGTSFFGGGGAALAAFPFFPFVSAGGSSTEMGEPSSFGMPRISSISSM